MNASNETVQKTESKIINSNNQLKLFPLEEWGIIIDPIIELLKERGLNSISDVEKLYSKYAERLVKEKKGSFKDDSSTGFIQGATLAWILEEFNN